MTMRITTKHLRPLVDRLNRVAGTPLTPYDTDADGRFHANIGNFHLSGAYGGHSLHQMLTEDGAIRDVFSIGHVPARALYDQIHAFLRGIEFSKAVSANKESV